MSNRLPDKLFEPFSVRDVTLQSRFVMPAMSRGWGQDGRPPLRYAEYFGKRVDNGVGLVITEACAPPHPTAVSLSQTLIIAPESASDWRPIVQRVHLGGGRILLQLYHEGAIRREGVGPFPQASSLSPSGLLAQGKSNGRAATVSELEEIRDAFASAALTAQEAGFDGVEIHGAHGFLLDLFLWSKTNLREDRYGGGTLLERLRYPAEVVTAVKDAVRPSFIVSFRFSQWKEADYGAKIISNVEELREFLRAFETAGIDLFNVSTRRFWEPEWKGSDLGLAGWAKQLTTIPILAVGSVGQTVDLMTSLLGEEDATKPADKANLSALAMRFARGDFDLLAVGRGLIGDAEWVSKVRRGEYAAIRLFRKADIMDVLLPPSSGPPDPQL